MGCKSSRPFFPAALLFLIFWLFLSASPVYAYCGGAYSSGDWSINTTVVCDGEVVPVDGSVSIRDDTVEINVTWFDASKIAAHDLRANSAYFDLSNVNSLLDLDPNTPVQYTGDWDSGDGLFKIAMNESQHAIQLFANIFTETIHFINVDDDTATGEGDSDGSDFVFGYYEGAGGAFIGCYNSSAGNPPFTPFALANNTAGTAQCGQPMDASYGGFNFTVSWNYSNDAGGYAFEAVINSSGAWKDKAVSYENIGNGRQFYTKFKNSPVNTSGNGSLTLQGSSLLIAGDFTVSAVLHADDSRIQFQTNNTVFIFNSTASALLKNTNITAVPGSSYYFEVRASDFTFENGFVDNTGVDDNRKGLHMVGKGGVIRNATFGENMGPMGYCIDIMGGSGISVLGSDCTTAEHAMIIVTDFGHDNTIKNNRARVIGAINGHDNLVENNTMTDYMDISARYAAYNNTYLNNVLIGAFINGIIDRNNTYSNYIVYNNSFGEIKWYRNDFNTSRPNLWIGNGIFIENNRVGVGEDADLQKFNVTAQIKFYGLDWSGGVQLLKNGIECNSTTTPSCNFTYDAATGVLVANVSGFSNYSTNGTYNYTTNETLVYCGGAYASGDWIVNPSITCSNEVIPVTGSLTVRTDSGAETNVTQFNDSSTAAHDLRQNSTYFDLSSVNSLLDLNPSTPSQYTDNWDSEGNLFKIAMNASQNTIQLFANVSITENNLYNIDLDNNANTGATVGDGSMSGTDVTFGFYSAVGCYIGCYNSSVPGVPFTFAALSNNTVGSIQSCGTPMNSSYNGFNFTVAYNHSNDSGRCVFEAVINSTGSWADKKTEALSGASWLYTKFKNSAVSNTTSTGNFTLQNVTLNVEGDFNVSAVLDAGNSTIQAYRNFIVNGNLRANASTIRFVTNTSWFNLTAGANVSINNSRVLMGDSAARFFFYVTSSNFTIENSFVDNTWPVLPEGIYFIDVAGGRVYNVTFGSNVYTKCVLLKNAHNVVVDGITCGTGVGIAANIGGDSSYNIVKNNRMDNVYFIGDNARDNLIMNNTFYSPFTWSYITVKAYNIGGNNAYNNTFLNNILINGMIEDYNPTYYNWFVYSNSFGEIRWYGNNFTIANATEFYLGGKIYIQNNLLGLADDQNLNNFNTPAQIKFYGLNWSGGVQLLRDGIECNPATAPSCNFTYDAGTGVLVANVSGFSNYTTNGTLGGGTGSPEPLYSCGYVNKSSYLTTNISSAGGNCLTISKANIVLDCGGNSITGIGTGYGIFNPGYANVTVKNCAIKKFNRGVYFADNSNYGEISNNSVINGTYGIYLQNSKGNAITGNEVSFNQAYGILLMRSDNNSITLNKAAYNAQSGILLHTSQGNYVWDNSAGPGNRFGITLQTAAVNSVTVNNASSNNLYGIYVMNSGWNDINGNTADFNVQGIALSSSSGNTVAGNVLKNNRYGIYASASGYNYITGNAVLSSNESGIYIGSQSKFNRLSGNSVNASGKYGMAILYSSNNTVAGNTMSSLPSLGIYLLYSSSNNITNNTANLNNYGIYAGYSNYNRITGNTAGFNRNYGIFTTYGKNNVISENNALFNNNTGIYLSTSSNYTLVSGNTVSSNKVSGISLLYSYQNSVDGNTADSNPVYGIYLSLSSYNNLTGNAAKYSGSGIAIRGSAYNTFALNNASNNTRYGFYLWAVSNYNNLTGNIAAGNTAGSIYIYNSTGNIIN